MDTAAREPVLHPEEAEALRGMRTRILGAVMTLVALGTVMVYSSSAVRAGRFGSDWLYLERQLVWLGIGLVGFAVTACFPMRWLRRIVPWIGIGSLLLLVAVRVPGIGTPVNGAYRWIRFGGFNMQPSELAKLGMVLVVAAVLARVPTRPLPFFRGFLPAVAGIGLTAGLVMIQPDFGTAALLAVVLGTMVFAAGVNLWHLGLAALVAIPPAVYVGVSRFDHVMRRVTQWQEGSCWQVGQSVEALTSGGTYGVGLGEGASKYFYLPEAHTDFIFAVLGQELGLVGTLTVLAMFFVIVLEGCRMARLLPGRFESYTAFGVVTMIGAQALFNIAVVTATIPAKGISLPFVSFGGSGLCVGLASIGVLVSMSREACRVAEDAEWDADADPDDIEADGDDLDADGGFGDDTGQERYVRVSEILQDAA